MDGNTIKQPIKEEIKAEDDLEIVDDHFQNVLSQPVDEIKIETEDEKNDFEISAVLPSPSSSNPLFSKVATTLTNQDKQYLPESTQRRGKGHFSLSELKECSQGHKSAPPPRAFAVDTHVHRPVCKSAAKFDKLLQQRPLVTRDSRLCYSDEDLKIHLAQMKTSSAPKNKLRRTTSSSSRVNRKSQTLESDKRDKRERNNFSSKRSRQKRKAEQELLTQELKQLELKNRHLKIEEKELAEECALWIKRLNNSCYLKRNNTYSRTPYI